MVEGKPELPLMSSGLRERVITRSDGVNFHLILADGPIFYPPHVRELISLGFWYVYRAKAAAVVVILRRPPSDSARLFHCIEQIADTLAEQLAKQSELPGLVEVDVHEFVTQPTQVRSRDLDGICSRPGSRARRCG